MQEKRKEKALRDLENGQEESPTKNSDDEDEDLPNPGAYLSDEDSVDSFTFSEKRQSKLEGSSLLHSSQSFPTSLREISDPKSADIVPLPAGRVLKKQVVLPSAYKYYQLEVVDKNSIVTIEVRCRKGLASLYLSRGYLPSSSLYEFDGENCLFFISFFLLKTSI
jgi:hypothetical protein